MEHFDDSVIVISSLFFKILDPTKQYSIYTLWKMS